MKYFIIITLCSLQFAITPLNAFRYNPDPVKQSPGGAVKAFHYNPDPTEELPGASTIQAFHYNPDPTEELPAEVIG